MGVVGSSNRDNIRRVKPPARHPPIYFLRVTDRDGTERVWDANTLLVNRNPYLIRNIFGSGSAGSSITYGEYEEDIIHFNNEEQVVKTFTTSFSQNPIVVLTLESSIDNSIIEPFVIDRTTTDITVGVTAPLSGTVRYRAVYSATYPVTVLKLPHFPSSELVVTAGSESVLNDSTVSITFPAVDAVPPSSFYFETFDETGSHDNAVNVSSSMVDVSSATGQLSAPITNTVFWIGYK